MVPDQRRLNSGREGAKYGDTTNRISGREGGPILLVIGSAMGTRERLYPKPNPMGVRNEFVATDKGLIRKDGKVISSPERNREE